MIKVDRKTEPTTESTPKTGKYLDKKITQLSTNAYESTIETLVEPRVETHMERRVETLVERQMETHVERRKETQVKPRVKRNVETRVEPQMPLKPPASTDDFNE